MDKTLILIRHAHRDNSRREMDNGLSEKGKIQAKALKHFFFDRFQDKKLENNDLWLVSSPKLRCVETLSPLAKALGRPVVVHPDLDEQSTSESTADLVNRVRSFLAEWRKSTVAITVVSSHGDWLPLALEELMGRSQPMKMGAWVEFEAEQLKWFLPTLQYFYRE